MKYEQYLEKVQSENPDEFEDLPTIINRHKLLVAAN